MRLATLTLVALLVCLGAAYVIASDSSTVSHGATQSVTAFSTCKKITNNSPTGKSLYVPTQSAAEWASFYANPPAGVTASSCAPCALPWGGTIEDGQSVTAYAAPTVSGTQCAQQTRTCSGGTLSGSYRYQSCYGTFSGAAPVNNYCTTCYLEDRNQEDPKHRGGIYTRYLLNNDSASLNRRCTELGFNYGIALLTYTPAEWCGTYSNASSKYWRNAAWKYGPCANGNVKTAECHFTGQ